jgi:hypothetical protein
MYMYVLPYGASTTPRSTSTLSTKSPDLALFLISLISSSLSLTQTSPFFEALS